MELPRQTLVAQLDVLISKKAESTHPRHWDNAIKVQKDRVVDFYKHKQKHNLERFQKA